MATKFLSKIESLYKKCDQFLKSGRFGEGLWPLDPQVGQLLMRIIISYRLRNGVEVGAGIGFSTSWLGAGFRQTGGRLLSLEYFFPKVDQLERNLKHVFGKEYDQIVQIVPSDFRKWLKNADRRKFDFVFLDHRKNEYLECLQSLIPRLRIGAFVFADNVGSHEKECREYLNFVRKSRKFETVTLDLGQGLEMSRFIG